MRTYDDGWNREEIPEPGDEARAMEATQPAEGQEPDAPERRRKFGPKSADHLSVGKPCKACDQAFTEGDYTTLIALGPGADREERARAREGRAYNGIAVEVHWACATGEVE